MTQSLARCITVEHFHSVKTQEDADAQHVTTELSLRDIVHELQGVLEWVACIALCEATVGDGDSRLADGKSESIRITCKELGIAFLLLDEVLDPNFAMGCCVRANIEQTLRRAVGLSRIRNLTQTRCRWR
jgi:hypothetical protein